MPSNHLVLCRPLLLLPSVFPSIRVFSYESVLHIRWAKYWSFSFSINPSKEHPGLISFRMDWLDLLAVQGTLKSLLQHHSSKASVLRRSNIFMVQLSYQYMTTSQSYGFSSSHVQIWKLDYKEGWKLKNWCFWTVVLEKTLESPLNCKEIKPVNPKGNQSWISIGRTDAEAETPILWPPTVKSWLIWKDPDAGKDWRQEEKGMTEDEMVRWHHWLSGHEFG